MWENCQDKWIEIARVGRFQDSSGAWHDFTPAKFSEMIHGYNPALREAPLVIGHPATNGPAYGWIKQLKIRGDKLVALPAYVSESVKKAVDNGLYKHVSISLYRDGGLRHVGLLGATPPAIDGLEPVSFNDDQETAATINFSDGADPEPNEQQPKGSQMTIEELTRQVGELQAKLNAALKEKDDAVSQAAALKEELAKLKGESQKTEAEFAAYRDKQELALVTGRIDQLVKDGKVTPAEKAATAKTAEALYRAGQAGALNFADGTENPLETYLKSLEARQPSEIFSSFSAPDDEAAADHRHDSKPPKPLSAKL